MIGAGDKEENRPLRHLWARKRIARLSDREAIGKGARQEITALGLEHGLMTAYTSFVAVDTVVRADGKKSRKVRQPIPLPKGVPDSAVGGGGSGARAARGTGTGFGYGGISVSGSGRGGGGTGYGTIGLGSLSTIGHGAGGGSGAGYGRGSGRTGAAPPSMKMGSAVVRGHLAKDVIRRIIRSRINEIRHCYEKALLAEPGLEGRVVIRFVIGADGKVASATVEESTFDEDVIENCMLEAIKRLTFPTTKDGGVNVVIYPFVLKPTP
jgi:TonB family protein